MKEKIKALWQRCFNDSPTFMDMYFELRYNEEVNLSIQEGEEVIAALQMLPYPMTFCGQTVATSYISGACTHPDFRGKGAMRNLLIRSFARMWETDVHLSTLIPAEPWLFDYYTGMGYASVFQYATREMPVPKALPTASQTITRLFHFEEEAYRYLNTKLAERTCCIQHTPEDFNVILTDSTLDNGLVCTATRNDTLEGIIIGYQSEEKLYINELVAESEQVEQQLLAFAGTQYAACHTIVRLLPPTHGLPTHTLGMARIIHAQEVLRLYASTFPEVERQFLLVDQQLPTNNGYYHLQCGTCRFSTQPTAGSYPVARINELTTDILQPLHPYMSLMLN